MSLEEEVKYNKLVYMTEEGGIYFKSNDPDILKKSPLGKLVGKKIIEMIEPQTGSLKNKKIIDIGSGPGGIALAFSKVSKEVTATDVSNVGLKFVEKRANLENIKNISFKKINLAEGLPFKDNSFDVAILKGVLEWVPETDKSGNPEEVQLKALKEIKRILKPGGTLFFAMENRYYIRYLFGLAEVHCGLHYVSFMPRKLANWYSLLVKRKPFRTYTYSYKELKRMFSKAGFDSWKFFTAISSYQIPEYVHKLNDVKGLKKSIDSYYKSNTKKLFAKFILSIPYLGPYILFPNNFIVILKK